MKNLTTQLEEFAENSRKELSEDKQKVMANDIENIQELDIVSKVIKTGAKFPTSELLDINNNKINLDTIDKKMVIVFYRGGWCPYCNLELAQYQRYLSDIIETGAELIAISPELPDESLNTKQKNELQFKVLTDVNNTLADELGLVHTLTPELAELYDSFGFEVTKKQGTEVARLPLPSTIIIDEDKIVRHVFVNADYKKRLDPLEVIDILKNI